MLVLAVAVVAEERIHLRSGRSLTGRIVSATKDSIVLDLGSGTIELPRTSIRLIEQAAGELKKRRVAERDEWFLVVHRGEVIGWRRLLHVEGEDHCLVEERTVFFARDGSAEVDIHRVEQSDADGNPLEFTYRELYGADGESACGTVKNGKMEVIVRNADGVKVQTMKPAPGWRLPLIAWSRFLLKAGPDESAAVRALDPRRLRIVRLWMRRDGDRVANTDGSARPIRGVTLRHGSMVRRALFRPGEGSHAIELNGSTLVAQRVSKERVEMARAAARGPERDWNRVMNPFLPKKPQLRVRHLRSGLSVKPPNTLWIKTSHATERGMVMGFENKAYFASMEVFVYDLPAGRDGARPTLEHCVRAALARLKLTTESAKPADRSESVKLAGHDAQTLTLNSRHRGENLRMRIAIVRLDKSFCVMVGACPRAWYRGVERSFQSMIDSLEVAE